MRIRASLSWKIGLKEALKLEKGILMLNMALNVRAESFMMGEAQDIKCQLDGFSPDQYLS